MNSIQFCTKALSSTMALMRDLWYPVLESVELTHKPLGIERLGQRMVFWRTEDGQPHAQIERCPHLGAALSAGHIISDRLVCPFHGFEFDGSGACVHIPANGKESTVPKGMSATSFTLSETHGFIWLWWGDAQDEYPGVPFFSILETGWKYHTNIVEWPVHYTRAIENQLDVAHLPFVHANTIGTGGKSFVDGPYVEADQQGIRVWVTNHQDHGQPHLARQELAKEADGKEPSLSFQFPGTWLLNISSDLKNFIAFVPVNNQSTRYYLRLYHHVHIPIISMLFEKVMGLSNLFILNQDKRVILKQTPTNSLDANQDRFICADRAIIEYRRHLKKSLKLGDTSEHTVTDLDISNK
ncbi:aromatic ring-hydroxylating oxygenase subunit alpha [Methylovulum psychrotolerans]|nr:aromatic ring-hydroxylating dioxygenase subunit alpha [Methylovulum psychrotolerans]